jgi:hypothetical protein
VLLDQETFVILGATALYALVVLAGYLLVSLLLSKAIRFSVSELGLAALASTTLIVVSIADDGVTTMNVVIATAFLASFLACHWPTLAKASIGVGLLGCGLAFARELIDEYPTWSRAVIPSAAFVVGTVRHYWLSSKPKPTGVWMPVLLVSIAAVTSVDIRFSELDWYNVLMAALMLPVVIATSAAWYQVQLAAACRKVLRSIPFATLIVVLFFGFCAFRQHLLVNEMGDLMLDQETMVANWKEEVAKVGPPTP